MGRNSKKTLTKIDHNTLYIEIKSVNKAYKARGNKKRIEIGCQNFKSNIVNTTVNLDKLENVISGINNYLTYEIEKILAKENKIWWDEDYAKLVQEKNEAYLNMYYTIFDKIAQSHSFSDGNKRAAFVMLVSVLEAVNPDGQRLTRIEYNGIDKILAEIVDHQIASKQEFLSLLTYTIGMNSCWYKKSREDFLLYGARILPNIFHY